MHVACGLYFCSEYEASIEASKRLIRSYPDFPMVYRWSAAALGQLGRAAEAKEELEKAVATVDEMGEAAAVETVDRDPFELEVAVAERPPEPRQHPFRLLLLQRRLLK